MRWIGSKRYSHCQNDKSPDIYAPRMSRNEFSLRSTRAKANDGREEASMQQKEDEARQYRTQSFMIMTSRCSTHFNQDPAKRAEPVGLHR